MNGHRHLFERAVQHASRFRDSLGERSPRPHLSARSLLVSAIRFHSWNQDSSSLGSIRLAVRKHSEMMEPPS